MSYVQILQVVLRHEICIDGSDWKKLVSLFKEAEGNESMFWAVQVEDKTVAGVAATWKSLEHQKIFSTSKKGELSAVLETLTAKPLYNDIVIFPVDACPTLAAPAVELVSWIHPVSKIDSKRETTVANGFSKFAEAITAHAPEGAGGLVGGWGQVECEHEGMTCRRFTAFIGWKSVEAHYACKLTPPFLENIHWLMENDHAGVEMVHYKYADSA